MYVILLRFSGDKSRAPEHMDGHRQWIKKGVDEGVFLLVGSIRAGQGGAILAAGPTPEALQERVDQDPFVIHGIVTVQVIDIDPSITAPDLALLAH
jgi:uncharacterized protein YciI